MALPASATRITVNQAGGADFETIQEGVNAAVSGDTVRVTPSADYTGPLNRDIDFHGKNITLESDHEYGACVVIDCEGLGRGLYFHSGEDTTAVVRRILVKNGYAGERGDGGAVYCGGGAGPVFDWCIFSDSHATGNGGGVYCTDGADARFNNCQISFNTSGVFGGGAYVWTSAPRFYGCTFQGNASSSQGGGAAMCYLTSAVFQYCRFTVNTAETGQGGGIYAQESDITVDGCIFFDNSAQSAGGISFWKASSPVIDGCDFVGNSSATHAGAVWCRDAADATITNSNFVRNDCPSAAAGIACWEASPTISNCVITSSVAGGAISCYFGTEMPDITHCYVFDNAGGNTLCGNYYDNRFENPYLCGELTMPIGFCSDSPCVAGNNPWGEAVGTGRVGCGPCNDAVDLRSWGSIKGVYR